MMSRAGWRRARGELLEERAHRRVAEAGVEHGRQHPTPSLGLHGIGQVAVDRDQVGLEVTGLHHLGGVADAGEGVEQELVAVGPVAVDGRPGHARSAGDGVDAEADHAGVGEQLGGSIQHGGPGPSDMRGSAIAGPDVDRLAGRELVGDPPATE